jgi:2-oxo-4-hydroxy-4-carboxy--5-ureidoimidazoline (OHCU) decarboxylase
MIVRNSKYKKKNGEIRNIEVYILKDDDNFIEGIDLNLLSQEEKNKFVSFINNYEKELDFYVKKAYRRFIKDSISETKIKSLKEEEENEYSGKGI